MGGDVGQFSGGKGEGPIVDFWQNMTTDLGVVPEIRRN